MLLCVWAIICNTALFLFCRKYFAILSNKAQVCTLWSIDPAAPLAIYFPNVVPIRNWQFLFPGILKCPPPPAYHTDQSGQFLRFKKSSNALPHFLHMILNKVFSLCPVISISAKVFWCIFQGLLLVTRIERWDSRTLGAFSPLGAEWKQIIVEVNLGK